MVFFLSWVDNTKMRGIRFVLHEKSTYHVLFEHRPKIGYSIFLYGLTHDRDGLAKLKETYVKAGVVRVP